MAAPALAAIGSKILPYLVAAMGASKGGGQSGGQSGASAPMAADLTTLMQHNWPAMKGQEYFGSGGPNNQFMFMQAQGARPSKTQRSLLTLLSALNNIKGAQTMLGGGGGRQVLNPTGRGAGAGFGGLMGGGQGETVGDFPRMGGGLLSMGRGGMMA